MSDFLGSEIQSPQATGYDRSFAFGLLLLLVVQKEISNMTIEDLTLLFALPLF